MEGGIWALLKRELGGKSTDLVWSLLGTILSGIQGEMSLVSELDDELAKLERTKTRIRARLEDADQRRRITDEHVRQWLRELDGFALDAEDLLDLVRTRITAFRQQENESAGPLNSRKRKRSSWSDFLPSSIYGYSSAAPLWRFKRGVAKEVEAVNKRFEEICNDRRNLQERRGDGMRRIEGPSPQVPRAGLQDQEFVGMGSDKERLLGLIQPDDADQLEKSEGKGISGRGSRAPLTQSHYPSVIAINGMGGSGKTTLVQSVYEQVEGFDKKIWIYVKKEHGPERITKEMLEALGEKNKYLNFDTSQQKLMRELAGKTLLLVLDNVDDSFLLCWDSVRASLRSVTQESKVIVTTRSARVPVAMGATAPLLEGLSEAEWLGLFKAKVGNLDGHPELEIKAKRIARKCQMSPLAAKVLGNLIFEIRDADEWENVLDEVLNDEEGNLIRKTLMTSYEQLPLRLKRCFAFCAIFPEGHYLDKEELARSWTALGFMEDAKRPEAAGRRCFEDLVRLSFIKQDPGTDKKVCYRMPGLMHELARAVSTHLCLTVEKQQDQLVTSKKNEARHALLHCAGVETERGLESLLLNATLNQANRLRTFVLLHGESKVCLNRLPADLFQKMRCLRVLDLSCTEICEIPNWIADLQLLRYLNLSTTLIAKLPDSVTTLLNLQTLNLSDCYHLHELPQQTSNLTNLRHLLLSLSHPMQSRLTSMPPEIGRLTGLQTLSRFIVGERPEGCGLDQLQHLNNIKGELWISNLENVENAEDARKANLAAKGDILKLTLQWKTQWEMPQHADRGDEPMRSQGSSSPGEQLSETENSSSSSSATEETNQRDHVQGRLNPRIAKDVIEQLHPQQYLKTLWIDNYYGDTPPEWVSQMKHLETVHLSHCPAWESLKVLEMLPQLKHLHVEQLFKVLALKPSDSQPDKFQPLETLTLLNMPNLQDWFIHEGQMPNLKELRFFHCAKLEKPRCRVPGSVKVEVKGCSFDSCHRAPTEC